MSPQVLVNQEEYAGKYVAMASFSDSRVIASGNDPAAVINEAERQGNDNAVILYVPAEPITCVY